MARWVKSHNQMRIFKQTATPAVVDGLKVGDLWIDINTGAILKICTSISPVTFVVDTSGNLSLARATISGTTQAAAINTWYNVANAAQTTITLPATAAVNDIVGVAGQGAGGWILAANTGQTIVTGSGNTTSGGNLTSQNQYDVIEVMCITANTTWRPIRVISSGLTIN